MSARIIFVLLIIAVVGAECAKTRTRRVTNGNSKSYDKHTRGTSLGYRPDQIVSTDAYRAKVRRDVKCTGPYCVDGKWACRRDAWGKCYNVEHIIDMNGKELRAYPACKNVAANLVMAHSKWNQQLGAIARTNYELSSSEKEAVYGAEMMNAARAAIRACQANSRRSDVSRAENALDEDISVNITESGILPDTNGLWLVPAGSNITCRDCNATWCYGECTCDQCTYLEYVDQDAAVIAIIVVFVVIVFAIGIASGIGVTMIVSFAHKRIVARKFREVGLDGRAIAATGN
jgi:hypothetical protein